MVESRREREAGRREGGRDRNPLAGLQPQARPRWTVRSARRVRPCLVNKSAHRERPTGRAGNRAGPALRKAAWASGPPPPFASWPSTVFRLRRTELFPRHDLKQKAARFRAALVNRCVFSRGLSGAFSARASFSSSAFRRLRPRLRPSRHPRPRLRRPSLNPRRRRPRLRPWACPRHRLLPRPRPT